MPCKSRQKHEGCGFVPFDSKNHPRRHFLFRGWFSKSICFCVGKDATLPLVFQSRWWFQVSTIFYFGEDGSNLTSIFFSDGLVKNHHLEMGVSKNRVFFPQIIHVNKVFHYKPSILEYHHFRKHPNVWMPGTGTCQCLWEDYSVDRLSLEGPGEVWRVAKVWSTWGGLTPLKTNMTLENHHFQ